MPYLFDLCSASARHDQTQNALTGAQETPSSGAREQRKEDKTAMTMSSDHPCPLPQAEQTEGAKTTWDTALRQGMPSVTLKLAMDRNGAVDDMSEGPKRFTSPASLDAGEQTDTRAVSGTGGGG